MSEIAAEQLTAVATLALAVFAFATAILALLAWRKQSREVRDQAEMLKLQAEELRQVSADREREALERRRAQAVQVYMWTTSDEEQVVAHVRNTSQQPAYEVTLQGVPEGGATMWLEPLMPGKQFNTSYTIRPAPGSWMHAITFRDRAGVRGETWPDGRLEELKGPPKPAKPEFLRKITPGTS